MNCPQCGEQLTRRDGGSFLLWVCKTHGRVTRSDTKDSPAPAPAAPAQTCSLSSPPVQFVDEDWTHEPAIPHPKQKQLSPAELQAEMYYLLKDVRSMDRILNALHSEYVDMHSQLRVLTENQEKKPS